MEGAVADEEEQNDDSFGLGWFIVLFIAGAGVPLLQVALWFKTGEWLEVPLSLGLDWIGIHVAAEGISGWLKVLDFVYNLPLLAVLWVAAAIPGLLAFRSRSSVTDFLQ